MDSSPLHPNSDRHPIPASPVPRALKAYENMAFLEASDGRAVRLLSEFMEPEARFRREGIDRTIVFFGSARIVPTVTAAERLTKAEADIADDLPGADRALKRAQNAVAMCRYYEEAVELAKRLTHWTLSLPEKKRFMLCSGGGPGIMEACNRGAYEAGGRSIGLNITLPFEQHPNPYITPELRFQFHYFLLRKFWFNHLCRAVIAFPGGLGTFDEVFEFATLLKTHRNAIDVPVVLYGREFWQKVVNLPALVDYGMINEGELDLFVTLDTVDEAFTYITRELSRRFL